ncbi:glycoside hydrolase family 3 protein, partial [Rhodococcus sp. CC-R104]|nr:glycoside hydrolase family 3 protein [Rhodococcus sp. CC-R104]
MRIRHSLVVVLAAAFAASGCGADSAVDVAPSASDAPASSEAASDEVLPSPTSSPAPPAQPEGASAAVSACGDELLASLTLRQKLAQLLNVGVTGADDALAAVQSEQIGGIFIGSWTDPVML